MDEYEWISEKLTTWVNTQFIILKLRTQFWEPEKLSPPAGMNRQWESPLGEPMVIRRADYRRREDGE